ncbi:hypothetical protein ACFL3Y_02110 [Pseudomonadota bacterium]
MSNQSEEFVALGMSRYKQASATLVSFGKEVETRLQKILAKRIPDGFTGFIAKESKMPRSTKYWSAYPLLNAKLDGEFATSPLTITIAVNWFESDTEYPIYTLTLDQNNTISDSMKEFDWQNHVQLYSDRGIQFFPNENDFNLERDFDILLDEISKFFDSLKP